MTSWVMTDKGRQTAYCHGRYIADVLLTWKGGYSWYRILFQAKEGGVVSFGLFSFFDEALDFVEILAKQNEVLQQILDRYGDSQFLVGYKTL